MKKYRILYLFLALMTIAGLSSCSETDDDENAEFANWQERNDAYFANIYAQAKASTDGSWKIIHSWSLNDSVATAITSDIVVKVINEGTGSGTPLYNDSCRVHYQGRFMPTTEHPSGYIFDSSWSGDYNLATMSPTTFTSGSLIDGFATALQNMHVGDRWQVYIPYDLGYGRTVSNSIPGYTTLIFDITLVAYSRNGSALPPAGAKRK